jgi:TPP-dependent trihydroxycyclohexane-1,2-dione (THcHDO) dehydratase
MRAHKAKAFGAHAVRISHPDEVAPALEQALAANRPAVVEVMVDTELGTSGGLAPGWWDLPVPAYFPEQRAAYEEGRAEERV